MNRLRSPALFGFVLAVFLGAGAKSDPPAVRTLAVPGVPVELTYRSLQPGEVVLASLKDDPAVRRVVLRFCGQTRRLEPAGNGTSGGNGEGPAALGLFGIDLGTKPGTFPLEVKIERPDGSGESFSLSLAVEARDFPSSRINVASAMLAPPPEEQERVKSEGELVATILSTVSPVWLAEGPFFSPLADYEPYPNFGQRRIYNRTVSSIHSGVDISAPLGTKARAANAGRVVLASGLYLSGNTVIIDHGLGVFTYCCHFSKLLVKRGDLVKKGDVIALVGSTGRSTGPHLHWSVRIGPSRVDPFSLVALPLI